MLAVNFWDEPARAINAFVKDEKLKQRVLLKGRKVGQRYGVKTIPDSYWIDRDGVIVDHTVGSGPVEKLDERTVRLVSGNR